MDAQVVQLIEVFGPPLISLFEKLPIFGPKSGPDRKAAAVAAIAAHPAAAAVDPGLIADAVQAQFDKMKADGTLIADAPVMALDETAIEAEVQKRVTAAIEAANSKDGKAPHGVVFTGSASTAVHG